MKKWITKGLLFCMLSLYTCMAAGCGSSSDSAKMAMGSSQESKEYSAADDSLYQIESAPTEMEEPVEDEFQETPNSSRKLITTMNLDVETTQFDTLLVNLEKRINQAGGYIESMNQWNGNLYDTIETRPRRNANLTVRIPANKLDDFIDTLENETNIVNISKSVEDVTLSYVDLESHKNALLSEQQRLNELMQQAETLEDILSIEERLTDVRYQLESMESQLRTYDNQINYSTVHLYIDEVIRITPTAPKSTWEEIRIGFTENMYKVVDGLRSFGIGLLVNLPIIVMAIIVVVILVLLGFMLLKFALKMEKRLTKQNQIQTKKEENKK